MTPSQQAVYETVGHDLRTDLESLDDRAMDSVPGIHELRKAVRRAHDIIESVFVDGCGGPEQADRVIERTLRKIAKEDAARNG